MIFLEILVISQQPDTVIAPLGINCIGPELIIWGGGKSTDFCIISQAHQKIMVSNYDAKSGFT